jgi:predicted transcriptional regulator
LIEAIRGSALAVESLDALDGSAEALKAASETLKSLASKMKETAEKEASFIDTRMATRAEREVQQEKEIEAFLELQKDERKRVEEEFEQKKAALYRIYAV